MERQTGRYAGPSGPRILSFPTIASYSCRIQLWAMRLLVRTSMNFWARILVRGRGKHWVWIILLGRILFLQLDIWPSLWCSLGDRQELIWIHESREQKSVNLMSKSTNYRKFCLFSCWHSHYWWTFLGNLTYYGRFTIFAMFYYWQASFRFPWGLTWTFARHISLIKSAMTHYYQIRSAETVLFHSN